MVQQFNWAGDDINLHGQADSDWAGHRQNMKSAHGGVITRSAHCVRAWSTSRSALALSSGAAELVRDDESGGTDQWCDQHGK